MKELTESVLDDIRNVPSISLDAFQGSILPQVASPTQISEMARRLQANGILQPDERWTVFPVDPCMETNEAMYFKGLETIAAAVVKEAKSMLGRDPTAIMQTWPNQIALSEGRKGQFMSDGHFALCESRGARLAKDESSLPSKYLCHYGRKEALACDRVEIEEYKLKDTWEDENDVGDVLVTVQWLAKADDCDIQNNKKVLGNAAQMLYADPSRRFMFGMTIANTTTRLWYFSRARVVVSESFNFITEYRHLIHYIVSMSFGSTEALGYDSSITRVAVPLTGDPARFRIQYDYVIDGETYRTVECLSSFRASGIISRATRVWTVRKLGDKTKQEWALKDFWIPLDGKMESEVQQDIFKRIEEKDPDAKNDPTLYRQYFMDIKACEVVRTCTDGKADTITDLLGPYKLYDVKRGPSSSAASIRSTLIFSNTADPVGGHLSARSEHRHSHRVYTGRKHVRVLFSEVGTPLDTVQNQKELFTGLLHAYRGLRYLYFASYVHRDFSSGNILLCSGKGKISDLEYCKVFQSEGPQSDPKMGTPAFMAMEVQCKRYLFKPMQIADKAAAVSALASIDCSNPFLNQQTVPVTPFLHNFYHDAESLWWIGVHSLFTTEPSRVERGQDARRIQREHFDALFPHHAEGSGVRLNFLRMPVDADITGCLPDIFLPVARVLDIIRGFLVTAYTSAEAQKDFPQYDHFAELFEEASVLDKALEKAVALAVNDIQPFQLDDQSMHGNAEDNVEWALDRLKEENYADDNAPENDADAFSGYIPKGSATKRPIDEVDKAESSNEEPPPKQPHRSSRIEKLMGAQ
ncbi:hypothetical protein IW261DRAFT_1647127 [Armillaria novae-zelandiae]|uniref:Fungal-type protein kinase domain-containing protein n=1 Tax=Armillaria novae-zelandiae TaxID=153914 RepID=A0AA39P0J2_9AGAR|nr:hypothetical protein IW261DRAFT_1647127 [Armillaria novae-zelandiae]